MKKFFGTDKNEISKFVVADNVNFALFLSKYKLIFYSETKMSLFERTLNPLG
jgi:hypothetical protein